MAYDETLAERLRKIMKRRKGITEKKMFGGIAFMCNGNMACGVVQTELMVRVGPELYGTYLADQHAREMDFTGKPLKGMLYINAGGITRDADLKTWVERALKFARSLPEK